MKTVTHACLSLALLAALAAAARADVLPVLLVVSPEGNAYRWNYSVQATAGITINAGDSFTFGDFAGLVPGSAQAPDGWQASVGIAAGGPSAPDLTFTYSGAALGGPLALGTFSAASAYSGHANAFFVAQVQAAGGGLTPWVVPVPARPPTGRGRPGPGSRRTGCRTSSRPLARPRDARVDPAHGEGGGPADAVHRRLGQLHRRRPAEHPSGPPPGGVSQVAARRPRQPG